MAKRKLFIYGIGRLAEYASYVFAIDSDYDVKGYCMEKVYLQKHQPKDSEIKVYEEIFELLQKENYFLFIAVGNNLLRERIYKVAKVNGFKMATYISSKASTWPNLETGENCFIDEGCVLQPFITIEDNTILFTSQIGHHTRIGKHVLISGSKTGGNVHIGNHCYIGLNASIKQNLKISNNCVIGMGCIIEKNISTPSVYTHKGTTKRNLDPDQISRLFLR